ncbi:MAG: DUF2314 domain-containing protein [Verrucomicrobiales bacterium]
MSDSHSPILTLLCSNDGERHTLTTLGLTLRGLSELQVSSAAGNHCRAAGFLMQLVARKLVAQFDEAPGEEIDWEFPREIQIRREDALAIPEYLDGSPLLAVGGSLSVFLTLEPFQGEADDVQELAEEWLAEQEFNEAQAEAEDEDEPAFDDAELNDLFSVIDGDDFALEEDDDEDENEDEFVAAFITIHPPPDYSGSFDDWMIYACQQLGHEAPAPKSLEEMDHIMVKAFEAARSAVPEFRSLFHRGLPEGHKLAVKHPLGNSEGAKEYVWVEVKAWSETDTLTGILLSDPVQISGYKHGQKLEFSAADVVDFVLADGEGNTIDPGFTQRLAEEFGIEIPSA